MLSMFGSMFQKKPEVDLAQKNVSVRSPDEILELEKLIKSGPVTFVFVHADWCGHCQTYKPIWNELLSVPGRSANMGMIHHDMVEKSPLLKNAKIPGYPTVLKVYSNGHIEKYKGENNEMTNAVPNARSIESMKKELLTIPILNMSGSSPRSSVIDSIELSNKNLVQNVTKMNKQNVVKTLMRNSNKKSLKTNLLNSLDQLLENNKQSKKANNSNNNNNGNIKVFAVSQKTKRNLQNRAPTLAIRNAAIVPKNNEISIGATKIVPPMTGGSLFTALAQAVQQAGPTAVLLLANEAIRVPPKKTRGSTMRLTRKNR